ncbi:MAG: secretion protein [Candidatus Diapherotrites archaeon CG11_big_fil_rev_8_21_14_0_20_37_9]|nr:MAG: secretion protein [Candidatus Diapherotrites archaeon CG11_big_fil_rev_8_21_14_0_20_37_9]
MAKIQEVRGDRIDSYGQVSIYEGFPFFFYHVSPPKFSDDERIVAESLTNLVNGKWSFDEVQTQLKGFFPKPFMTQFREKIINVLTYNQAIEKLMPVDDLNALKLLFISLLKEHFPNLKNYPLIVDNVLARSIGYGILDVLLSDDSLEEVMVNGYDREVFVFHRRYGTCKTNVIFSERRNLDLLLEKIAATVGRKFDPEYPLLDARLPDGNRANATYSFVTPYGPSLTIRKFAATPLSIVDLVGKNTISSDLAAFLWVMVEGLNIEPMSLIVTGGSGTGKTTTLNALTSFIRFTDRVISIEDTLELSPGGRQNWVQMESRASLKGQAGVSMDDLLKNAMRMRPDRLIVGEVRGKEAETLFVAMDTGHKGCLGTLHSNSAKEMLVRLKAEPMNVPDALLSLLDIIVVQYRVYIKGKGVERRVLHVTEVSSLDGRPLLSNIYEWDRSTDSIKRTDVPMRLVERVAEKTLKTKKEIEREILVRKRIIEWMLKEGVTSPTDVETIIQRYYFDPESLLNEVFENKPQ